MRNEIAASHPNVENIGGFELLGYLQTCVKDVLQDQISDSAINVKLIISSLSNRTEILDESNINSFK